MRDAPAGVRQHAGAKNASRGRLIEQAARRGRKLAAKRGNRNGMLRQAVSLPMSD